MPANFKLTAIHTVREANTSGKLNNAFKVKHGYYGSTKLDGAKFWVAADLGSDFSKGQVNWAVLTFDPAVTAEQREGIETILGRVYPVKWNRLPLLTTQR